MLEKVKEALEILLELLAEKEVISIEEREYIIDLMETDIENALEQIAKIKN